MFDEWIEEVENLVYVYFNSDLNFFVNTYDLDLNFYFSDEYTPMMMVSEIQSLLEQEEDFFND